MSGVLPPEQPNQADGDVQSGIPIALDDDEIEEAIRDIEDDPPPPPPHTRDVSEQAVRASIINILLSTFIVTIVLTFISFWAGKSSSEIKDLLEFLLPAQTALLGTAVGFYYGTRKE